MDEKRTAVPEDHSGENSLTALLKEGRKHSKLLRILMATNIVLTIGVLIILITVVPRVVSMTSNVQDLVKKAEASLSAIEELTEQAGTSLDGIDEMVQNANTILEGNASGMNEALGNFNSVDFERLNEAIRSLADAVAPLADFARMFE